MTPRETPVLRIAAGLAAVGWLALAGCEHGGKAARDTVAKDRIARGRTVYERYCVSCHGKEARGGGPLAMELRVPVPDVTTLAARSGGVYPEQRVIRIISKGNEVRGHGTEDMPAWGPVFNRTSGIESAVDESIRNLALYLGSLQRTN